MLPFSPGERRRAAVERAGASTRPSEITSASAARIGAAVITGEAILTRRRALAIAFPIRAESPSPCPSEPVRT